MPRSGEALFLEELGRAAEGEIDPLFEELYRWYASTSGGGNSGGDVSKSGVSALCGRCNRKVFTVKLDQFP